MNHCFLEPTFYNIMPKPAPIITQTFSSILIYPKNIKTDVIVDKPNVKKMLKTRDVSITYCIQCVINTSPQLLTINY